MNIFHYAFKVKDLASTRQFYIDLMGCEEGRSTDTWVDFDFFGHQLSAHLSNNFPALDYCGHVDGVRVPIPHFGCLLSVEQFHQIRAAFSENDVEFIIQPQRRYEGKTGDQWTMFVLDFSNNPLEFKAFVDEAEVFAK